LAGPAEQMGVAIRQACPLLEDVALPIGHDGDPCGRCAEQLLGCVGTNQPAVGFLLFDRQLTIVGRLSFLAPPNLRMDEAEARAIIGIHRQDGMQEQPDIGTIADAPEIVLAVGLRLVIDLGRILNRQNVPTAHQIGGPFADGLDDLNHLHPSIVQKSPELSLARYAVTPQNIADRLIRNLVTQIG
jgi:hypothetical protein